MLSLALATLVAASEPPVVTVLNFDNNSKDEEVGFLCKGLTDLLITDLLSWNGVRVVERTRIQDVIKELEFQQSKYVDKKTAAKLGQLLATDYIVQGSILATGQKLTVNARLVRASSGEALASVAESDERDKIFELEQRLAGKLVAAIDSSLSADAQARRKTRVPNAETVIAYGKALDLSDQGKLEEAQAAMRQVVSSAPTFLLARQRQQELLQAFEEYKKRRRDLITGSVLEVGKLIDRELAAEAKFDTLTPEQTGRYLTFRALKGRFLARSLKQHLGSHASSLRLAKKGSEGQALLVMRAWVQNQRRGIAEVERMTLRLGTKLPDGRVLPPSLSSQLSLPEQRLIEDSMLFEEDRGSANFNDLTFGVLARFVLSGYLQDGNSFYAAPLVSAVDPGEEKAIKEEIQKRFKGAIERHARGERADFEARGLTDLLVDHALQSGDVDTAVSALQAFLDAFPTFERAKDDEQRLLRLLEGRGNNLEHFERWADALKTCKDMSMRVGVGIERSRLLRAGLKGLDEMMSELEQACPGTSPGAASGLAYVAQNLAFTAAQNDDCDRYRAFWRRFVEYGGNVNDMVAWARRYEWCPLGDVTRDVVRLHAFRDSGHDFEMRRHLVSVLSYDEKVLTIMGSEGTPPVKGDQEQSFDLRFERDQKNEFTCKQARWRTRSGVYLEAPCTAKLTKVVPKGQVGYDEGTFEATFSLAPEGEPNRKISLTRGEFRVRRD